MSKEVMYNNWRNIVGCIEVRCEDCTRNTNSYLWINSNEPKNRCLTLYNLTPDENGIYNINKCKGGSKK